MSRITPSGKRALRSGMACKAQAAAVVHLRRGFATPQAARFRRCTRREGVCGTSWVVSRDRARYAVRSVALL